MREDGKYWRVRVWQMVVMFSTAELRRLGTAKLRVELPSLGWVRLAGLNCLRWNNNQPKLRSARAPNRVNHPRVSLEIRSPFHPLLSVKVSWPLLPIIINMVLALRELNFYTLRLLRLT
jgi:hypothetical protein